MGTERGTWLSHIARCKHSFIFFWCSDPKPSPAREPSLGPQGFLFSARETRPGDGVMLPACESALMEVQRAGNGGPDTERTCLELGVKEEG